MISSLDKGSVQNLLTLIENAHSIILRWDDQGILQYINQYGAHFFGYSQSEMIGKSVKMILTDHDSSGKDLTGLVANILPYIKQSQLGQKKLMI